MEVRIDASSMDGGAKPNGQAAKAVDNPLCPPLSVDEALQFSPFSSILPFASDPIPVPTTGSTAATPLPKETYNSDSTRSLLKRLDADYGKTKDQPGQAPLTQRTIDEVQKLLGATDLTKLQVQFTTYLPFSILILPTSQFKPSFSAIPNLPNRPKPKNSGGYFNGLGPFAKAMVKMTDLKLSYPSPKNVSKPPVKQKAANGELSNPNVGKVAPSVKIEVRLSPTLSKPNGVSAPPKSTSAPKVVIAIPSPLSTPSKSKTAPQPTRFPSPSSKKRKRSDAEPVPGFSVVIDPKQKSEITVKDLTGLLSSIFEAEDFLQADTSGLAQHDEREIFISEGPGFNQTVPILTSSMQSKVEKALTKVISEGRFKDIDIEDLVRLQRICQRALSEAEALALRLPADLEELEVDSWARGLEVAAHGMGAARILLRILAGGRVEKQLYSEEVPNSILALLRGILSDALIPIVELRNSGPQADRFKKLGQHKKILLGLLSQSNRILQLLTIFLKKEELSDTAINAIETVTINLIFVENAHTDKDSILGVQKFERFRTLAMDVLANVYSHYQSQRMYIFDEVLTSLEKLPVTRQSARQFKLMDGPSIQLVSALMMKLVQACATQSNQSFGPDGSKAFVEGSKKREGGSDDEEIEKESDKDNAKISEAYATRHPHQAVQNMLDLSSDLFEQAQKTAQHAIQFLVSRAMRSTKTGESPYRNLLDIFTEDFIAVVESPDWPAAELLLRILLLQMIQIAEAEKSPAPQKNMALDLMGLIGPAVSKIIEQARKAFQNSDGAQTELSIELSRLAKVFFHDQGTDQDLLPWKGPYRMSVESLTGADFETLQIQSAVGYHVNQWATRLAEAFDNNDTTIEDEVIRRRVDTEYGGLAFRLRHIMLDHKWLKSESHFDAVSSAEGRLAYSLIIMNTPLCKGFHRVLLVLLNAMNSDQATVRSKSMKSLVQLLESDGTILDRYSVVVSHISDRASDQSPLVRDSAIALLAKCMTIKPSLEEHVSRLLLSRAGDTAPGVRKRSMRLLKDIYVRTKALQTKVLIAEALLHRVKDTDDGVADLARTIFEELWMVPLYGEPNEQSVQQTLLLRDQIGLIVKVLSRGALLIKVFTALIQLLLSKVSKTYIANFTVCKSMVATLFESAIDVSNDAILDPLQSRQETLRALSVFAESEAKLFIPDQLYHIQPYLDNLSSTDDIHTYRSVLVIFRYVLPTLNDSQISFMRKIQDSLLKTVTKLNKREQDELVQCLWVMNKILQNTERLSRVTISCLEKLVLLSRFDFTNQQHEREMSQAKRLITIAGLFMKHCDFDDTQLSAFQSKFPKWKGNTVAGLTSDLFAPFTSPKHPIELRRAALDGLGSICQSWPKEYLKTTVCSAFDIVFSENNRELENFVLSGFKDFMTREEKRSEVATQAPDGAADEHDTGRLSGAVILNQNDGVSTSIAQRYLQPILRVALSSQDAYALTAVELVASINRQGLVHPKESGPVLVALETSTNATIAAIALREHRLLHQKHESIVEKEYQKAVQQAFDYQKNVVGDALGATKRPMASKLRFLYDILKISKVKLRKKFFMNLCAKVDFEPTKLDAAVKRQDHIQFARFIIENLAFFEYGTVDELLFVINAMERVVKNTGTGVAHSIEIEMPSLRAVTVSAEQLEQAEDGQKQSQGSTALNLDPDRLEWFTVMAMILLALWQVRTFLRRLYGTSQGLKAREDNSKALVKELAKAPVKSAGVVADRFWDELVSTMNALESEEKMLATCKQFLELLSVDTDFKVTAESDHDDNGMGRGNSLSGGEDNDDDEEPNTPGQAGRGKKRKTSHGPQGRGPPKKSKNANGKRSRRGSANSAEEERW
ncbi:MAG: Sister chromatid cohesion protein 2 [Vezdaea aestivalis]|nr:MAG: Sister chromatid cohesion protein 2 [Vezdaea aestivalis]